MSHDLFYISFLLMSVYLFTINTMYFIDRDTYIEIKTNRNLSISQFDMVAVLIWVLINLIASFSEVVRNVVVIISLLNVMDVFGTHFNSIRRFVFCSIILYLIYVLLC